MKFSRSIHSIFTFVMAVTVASAALAMPTGAYASEISFSDADLIGDSVPMDAEDALDAYVSGGDVSATDHLSDYSMSELNVDYFRLKMLVPELENSFSAQDTNAELHDKLYEDYGLGTREEILNYVDYYGSGTCYLYNGNSPDNDVSIMVMYDENQYTRFIGDYSKLSKEELDDICENSDFLATLDTVYPRSIHGRTFLYQVSDNPEYNSSTYLLNTIVNGGKYTFYVELKDPSAIDDNMVQAMFDSIRLKGVKRENYNSASSAFTTILAVVCGLLAAAVALLGFFIYRFNAFAKAAGSSFSIVGFNLPPKDAQPAPRGDETKPAGKSGRKKPAKKAPDSHR